MSGLAGKLSQVLAGERRAHMLPTLAIAALVTAAVAIPLSMRATDASDAAPPASIEANDRVQVVDAGSTGPLDGAVLSGPATIEVTGDQITAIAWQLYEAGGADAVAAGSDLEAPYRVASQGLDEFLVDGLTPGAYELFLTVSMDSNEDRVVSTFSIVGP